MDQQFSPEVTPDPEVVVPPEHLLYMKTTRLSCPGSAGLSLRCAQLLSTRPRLPGPSCPVGWEVEDRHREQSFFPVWWGSLAGSRVHMVRGLGMDISALPALKFGHLNISQ